MQLSQGARRRCSTWPNDPEARSASLAVLRGWAEGSRVIPIQTDWARVADVFNVHHDLTEGGHQRRRGEPSTGKAIAVVAGTVRARGAHSANLWRAWTEYKDVAHLVTAATIISADARQRAKVKPFGEFGFDADRLPPFTIAMMMPDFVLSVALSLQWISPASLRGWRMPGGLKAGQAAGVRGAPAVRCHHCAHRDRLEARLLRRALRMAMA